MGGFAEKEWARYRSDLLLSEKEIPDSGYSGAEVVEEGSPAELMMKENGIFRRMTYLQSASAGWSI